jgi:hypothetical protein
MKNTVPERRIRVTVTTEDGEVLDSASIDLPTRLGFEVTELEVGATMPDSDTPGYLGCKLAIGKASRTICPVCLAELGESIPVPAGCGCPGCHSFTAPTEPARSKR